MDYMNYCPLRLLDRHFDSYNMKPFHSNHFYRPWYKHSGAREFGSTTEETKDKYKINLDVQHFQPNEIYVKVTEKDIIIEGKHEERAEESGFISRQFKRRYPLPSNCSAENVFSTLSSDGVLSVIAEKMKIKGNEKIVPIQISGSCPMKTHTKTSITHTSTGITQKDIDDAIREAKELISMDKAKMLKEDHSSLMKPELLKEAVSGTKEVISEKINFSSGAEEKAQSNIKMSDLMDKLAQSSSETYGARSKSETIREEKKSTYKSSKTSSTKASEYISAELSDAAENL